MKKKDNTQDVIVIKKKKKVKHKTLNNTNWVRQSKLAWFVSFLLLLGFIFYLT